MYPPAARKANKCFSPVRNCQAQHLALACFPAHTVSSVYFWLDVSAVLAKSSESVGCWLGAIPGLKACIYHGWPTKPQSKRANRWRCLGAASIKCRRSGVCLDRNMLGKHDANTKWLNLAVFEPFENPPHAWSIALRISGGGSKYLSTTPTFFSEKILKEWNIWKINSGLLLIYTASREWVAMSRLWVAMSRAGLWYLLVTWIVTAVPSFGSRFHHLQGAVQTTQPSQCRAQPLRLWGEAGFLVRWTLQPLARAARNAQNLGKSWKNDEKKYDNFLVNCDEKIWGKVRHNFSAARRKHALSRENKGRLVTRKVNFEHDKIRIHLRTMRTHMKRTSEFIQKMLEVKLNMVCFSREPTPTPKSS